MNADPWVMNARVVSVHFDSIIELMDYDIRQIRGIGSGCIEKFEQLVGRVGAGEADIGWLARTNKTHKDVIEHASIGDPELYDLVKQMSAAIDRETGKSTVAYMQEVHRPKRKLRFGDFGDELDIHKIYQGHSDAAWARRVRHPVMEKMSLVTLYVDIGGNSRMIADESLWRAAVAVKLADDYSAAGKSVKIIVGSTASGALAASSQLITQSIVVKHYNERLPLERLAAMCHLGFHRTFSFAGRHCQPMKVCPTYGTSIHVTDEILPIGLREEIAEGHTKVIIVPRCTTLTEAVQSIRSVYDSLEKQK